MAAATWTETERLAALERYVVLDTPPEQAFDDLAALAARLLDAPVAVVNLIGDRRQFFKAETGLGVRETPIETSFCVEALLADEIMVVEDARDDPRFACNPLVTGEPHLRAYAGALLRSREGPPIGTLCVLDYVPRRFDPGQIDALRMLTRQVVGQLELRRTASERDAGEHASRHKLEVSEESLRLATEAAEVGTWDLDVVSDTLAWSDRCKAMFGISPDVPVSMRDFTAGLHPEDVEATTAAFAAALDPARRLPYDVEYRAIGKEDGVVRCIAAKGKGLFDENGVCTRAIGTVIDVSEHRATTSRLVKSEAALRALNADLEQQVIVQTRERGRLWRNARDMLLVIDRAGSVVSVNPAVTDILGWSEAELVGGNIAAYLLPEDRHLVGGALTRVGEGTLREFQARYRHKDGGHRWMAWVAAPEGELIFATGRHITAQKEAEAELEATQEALRQAQKMEAVGQLTGGLAHDFNNLLTGMMGNLELLQLRLAQGRAEDAGRFIAAAQGAGRRAAALTQRLLAFSRRQTLDPKPTDVNRLVVGMEELVRRTVGPSITIEVVGAAGLWTALIDPGQLENALLNLCINARDAMPDGGRLTIETANKWLDERSGRERDLAPGQYLSVCVSDTGTGMTPEVIARAFDPFYTTKPIGEGTGLGLSMIYGFARQSGGQVRIYSELGRGTTMCIYLPRHLGEADMAEPLAEAGRGGVDAAGETVLVIDDEPTIRQLVVEVLEERGYRVLDAGDGAAGLKLLQAGARVDLLVTDVGLPGGMNGRQVADAARALRPGLKILFITGYAENAAVGNGHLEPGMELLTKPFSLDDLGRRIGDLLGR